MEGSFRGLANDHKLNRPNFYFSQLANYPFDRQILLLRGYVLLYIAIAICIIDNCMSSYSNLAIWTNHMHQPIGAR